MVPVLRTVGTPDVLKLQPVDDETAGESLALRNRAGRGAVRRLNRERASGSMLVERLDRPARPSTCPPSSPPGV
ncbi:aminoglycoside phosphotransferase family protein [Kitasatospora sp. NPDC059599]|uniref:aminoglycoside phosphotransferase family protein n=1 Tax=Kitasatospora sp. NPDC059599 TaxID=3346880 RepID=UPI0036C9E779